MPANPPENMPRISPYLLYEDVDTAITWLAHAFGLRERTRLPGPDGKAVHAEMELEDGVIMMGNPGPDYVNPKRLGSLTQHLYVYVDDVDQHHSLAKQAGAEITEAPSD
jgi:PhnB protein